MMAEVKKASEPREIGRIEFAKGQHWNVPTLGWPDFLCMDYGDVIAIEVNGSAGLAYGK